MKTKILTATLSTENGASSNAKLPFFLALLKARVGALQCIQTEQTHRNHAAHADNILVSLLCRVPNTNLNGESLKLRSTLSSHCNKARVLLGSLLLESTPRESSSAAAIIAQTTRSPFDGKQQIRHTTGWDIQ